MGVRWSWVESGGERVGAEWGGGGSGDGDCVGEA